MSSIPPGAATVSVRDVLSLLDGPFGELAEGVAQGRYALWLGSGISRDRMPPLLMVVQKVLAYLQARGNSESSFQRGIEQNLEGSLR
jgi:hypothetical protein